MSERWNYYRTRSGWDLHVKAAALGGREAVIGFKCSAPRIKITSRALELDDALRRMRVAFGSKGRDADPEPFLAVMDDLPHPDDVKSEPQWGLERYPWGQARFIYEIKKYETEDGDVEIVTSAESVRISDEYYELRRVSEDVVEALVRSLECYWSLGRHLEYLNVRW